ncbi:MAG: hypothetical protein HY273_02365 [Gammaproteobacteria bacterium]|nr:hypothetical protein [Gammaproteobacteria bacterium]
MAVIQTQAQIDGERAIAFFVEQPLQVHDGLHAAMHEPAVGDEDRTVGKLFSRREFEVAIERQILVAERDFICLRRYGNKTERNGAGVRIRNRGYMGCLVELNGFKRRT